MYKLKTPLQIKGSNTTVRICDADGKTLATINKALGEHDNDVAQIIVNCVNEVYGSINKFYRFEK
jgi:hypothetical protein